MLSNVTVFAKPLKEWFDYFDFFSAFLFLFVFCKMFKKKKMKLLIWSGTIVPNSYKGYIIVIADLLLFGDASKGLTAWYWLILTYNFHSDTE